MLQPKARMNSSSLRPLLILIVIVLFVASYFGYRSLSAPIEGPKTKTSHLSHSEPARLPVSSQAKVAKQQTSNNRDILAKLPAQRPPVAKGDSLGLSEEAAEATAVEVRATAHTLIPPPKALPRTRKKPRLEEIGVLKDRRENPGPDGATVLAAVGVGMDMLRDEISSCLELWTKDEPDFSAQVDLAFQIDAEGLQKAWIARHSKVPLGPLSCFGSAIYEIDWSGMTTSPIEVTFTFKTEEADSSD